jgi:tRNA 2-thiouridine synthesizing protein A
MDENELRSLEVAKLVDARGTACPGPLLAAKRSLAAVPIDGIMELVASDAGTNKDIPRWCKKMKHLHLGTVEQDGNWHLYVQRKR